MTWRFARDPGRRRRNLDPGPITFEYLGSFPSDGLPHAISDGRPRTRVLLDQGPGPVHALQVAEAGLALQDVGFEGERLPLFAAGEQVEQEE